MSDQPHTPAPQPSTSETPTPPSAARRASGVSVTRYVAILFLAALVLLGMSLRMQQRSNAAALEGLDESLSALEKSRSALETLDGILAENAALKDTLAGLEAELEAAQEALAATQDEGDIAQARLTALQQLNQVRSLYNKARWRAARALITQWEEAAPGVLEQTLADVRDSLSEEARADYDPYDAYQTIYNALF